MTDAVQKNSSGAAASTALERTMHVKPGEKVNIPGVPFDSLDVNIINGDVILLNPLTKQKLIFPGMALFLFDPADAPTIIINGETITPDMFLAKLGLVGTATEEQYLSFTTLNIADQETSETSKEAQEKIEELQELLEEAQKKVEEMDAAKQESETLMQVALMSANQETQEEENTEQFEEPIKLRIPVSEGMPPQPEPIPASSKSSSSRSSAESDATEDNRSISDTSGYFGFKTFLLQMALSEGTEDVNSVPVKAVYGGGGSDTANFNPSNESQIAPEVINYSSSTDDLVIYANDPNFFTGATSARVIEISSNLPDGFFVSEGIVSGLPSGFFIQGAASSNGSYVLTSQDFMLNDRGDIQMVLVYPVPGSQTFDLKITFTATYDPASGVAVPQVTTQTHSVTHPVELKDVSVATDLNYTGADGREVWVLANQVNANTILSGTGNDIIHGSMANDVINGNSGNDLIHASAGNDTIDGGGNSDTIDYSTFSDPIIANLSNVVAGYANIQVGAIKTDQVIRIENIIGGRGNDNLIGDNNNNNLYGGDGNDILDAGGTGDDTLDGGNGFDSVSFLSGATTGMVLDLNVAMTGTVINVGNGNKTLISIENIVATNFNDTIYGNTENNSLSGADGNDTFIANSGLNFYDGGFNGVDTSLTDLISYINAATGISVNLSGPVNANGYVTLNAGSWATDGIKNIEYVTGSNHNDTITGNARDNLLRGESGNDFIDGGDGNDTIYGGAGSDNLNGGSGTNVLRFDDLTGAGLTFTLSTMTSGTAIQGPDTDTFSNFQTYYLTNQNDTAHTSSGADVIYALSGDDIFIGSAGNDALYGGDGNDTIDYSAMVGTVLATTLGSSFTVTLSGAINAVQTMTSIERIIGTQGNDTFVNGSGSQTIDGGGGTNNSLSYITSTSGILSADMSSLTGGYFVISLAGPELDYVANIQTLIGTNFSDSFRGDSNANTLFGMQGDDFFIGSAGGDTYDGGAGVDTLNYGATTNIQRISANLASGTATLTFQGGGTSVDSLTSIENIQATSGNDNVVGNALDNTITDAGGNDTFDGGGGVNTISYANLSGFGVTINLTAGEADDNGDSIANDVLLNFVNATGSNQNDIIIGNGLANILHGGAGSDTLRGEAGNDTLFGDTGDDIIYGGSGSNTINGGDGIDTASYDGVGAGVTANLATGVVSNNGYGQSDTLISIESFIGGAQNDVLTTGATTVNVNMGGGNDTIHSALANTSTNILGGAGIDTLNYSLLGGVTGEFENNQAVFSRGVNNDRVSGVERFVFGAAADAVSIDTNSLVNLFDALNGTVNMGGGVDTVRIYTGSGGNLSAADIDGDTLASIFSNIEQLDLRSTTVNHGVDAFSVNSAQIMSMTSSNALTILINTATLSFSDFNVGGTYSLSSGPMQQTYTFTDNPGVTLTIQASA